MEATDLAPIGEVVLALLNAGHDAGDVASALEVMAESLREYRARNATMFVFRRVNEWQGYIDPDTGAYVHCPQAFVDIIVAPLMLHGAEWLQNVELIGEY